MIREQVPRRQLASGIAAEAERLSHGSAEQGIPEGGEDQPQCGLADRAILMAGGELVDQTVDRVEHRVERVAIAREDHPGGERPGAFLVEGVEGPVDHLARIGLAMPRALHGLDRGGATLARRKAFTTY